MKSVEEIEQRLNRLWAHNIYSDDPRGDELRLRHHGMIDALHWVLEGEENE